MVAKIVSHLNPRHLDDFLAIALLKTVYPSASVEYVHPQKVPQEYLEDKGVVLVDVGGDYNPDKNNYDHHQDRELPCSLSLVIKHFFPEIGESPALKAIDLTDRFGFQRTVELGLAKVNKEVDELRKIILLVEPMSAVGFTAKRLLEYAAGVGLDYESFIRMLYETLKVQGLTREAEEKVQQEKAAFREKVSKVEYVDIQGFKVAISRESLAPYHSEFFSQTGVDVLIEQNIMNKEHTSIIVNTSKATKDVAIEFADKLASSHEIVFRHNTGFIRVLNVPVEDFIKGLRTSRSQGLRKP